MAHFKTRFQMGRRVFNNFAPPEAAIRASMIARPTRKGGSIHVHGPLPRPVNRGMYFPFNYVIRKKVFNHGGTSDDFGSRYMGGYRLHRNDRTIWRVSMIQKEDEVPPTINATAQMIPGVGALITASTPTNFGFGYRIENLPAGSRIVAAVTKVKGSSFVNWESQLPAPLDPELRHMKPGTAIDGQQQLVVQLKPMRLPGEGKIPDAPYYFMGVTNVQAGDAFIVEWMAIIHRKVHNFPLLRVTRKI